MKQYLPFCHHFLSRYAQQLVPLSVLMFYLGLQLLQQYREAQVVQWVRSVCLREIFKQKFINALDTSSASSRRSAYQNYFEESLQNA